MDVLKIAGERTDAFVRFMDEWNNRKDYVTAHTSGSTGKPKEIRLKKSDMRVSAQMTCDYLGIVDHPTMALTLSPEYIAGKMMIVRAMESEAVLYIESPSSYPLNNYNIDSPIDLLAIVPAQLAGFLESHASTDVKNLLIGGSPLPHSLEQLLIKHKVNAYVTYGMTETCSHIALRKIGSTYYRAFNGIRLSVDSRGCLVIESDYLSFNRLVTNDIVNLIDSRTFEWLGRVDNVINSGGIKLYPESIEQKIATVFNAAACYITSTGSERWGEELVMMVESDAEIPGLKESLSAVLHKYEMPKQIIYQSEFQRTESGKIIRKKS